MNKYRIHEIKLTLDEKPSCIPQKIREKLRRQDLAIDQWRIAKESVDARDKGQILRVFLVDFETPETLMLETPMEATYQYPNSQDIKRPDLRPVVVGFGPGGIFAAWILASLGFEPIVLERGKPILERDQDVDAFWQSGILDEESNVQFGEGGAGAYSDGKLTTGTKDPRNRFVLETLVQAGADPEILYKKKPHIGTDVLKQVVSRLRAQIIEMGGDVRFQSKVTDLIIENGTVAGVEVNGNQVISTSDVILTIGHSARDTFRILLQKGLSIEPKPFSMGVRIEHPQHMIDGSQYGDAELARVLGPAEYKLVHHCQNGRGLYSFCMCPGGHVITSSSEKGGVVVNGMSYHARDGVYANSGILTDVRIEDYYKGDPLDGMEFQRAFEQAAFRATGKESRPPRTTWGEFKSDDGNVLRGCLPEFVVESLLEGIPAFGKKIKGFDKVETLMTGVETRSSSPVRIPRDAQFMSNINGLLPGGEGAGHAGGIISAAVDGVRLAEAVATRIRL